MAIENQMVLAAIRDTVSESGSVDADRDEQDARTLVKLLAAARSKEIGEEKSDSELYAATILCFVFDPVKARRKDHPIAMEQMRQYFIGVSKSNQLAAEFRHAFTADLLRAKTAGDAIELGPERLFSLNQTRGLAG
jgi:hypothetical protein